MDIVLELLDIIPPLVDIIPSFWVVIPQHLRFLFRCYWKFAWNSGCGYKSRGITRIVSRSGYYSYYPSQWRHNLMPNLVYYTGCFKKKFPCLNMFSERNNGYSNIKLTPFDKGKVNLNFDVSYIKIHLLFRKIYAKTFCSPF